MAFKNIAKNDNKVVIIGERHNSEIDKKAEVELIETYKPGLILMEGYNSNDRDKEKNPYFDNDKLIFDVAEKYNIKIENPDLKVDELPGSSSIAKRHEELVSKYNSFLSAEENSELRNSKDEIIAEMRELGEKLKKVQMEEKPIREEHMKNVIVSNLNLNETEKPILVIVGDTHVKNLKTLLRKEGVESETYRSTLN